VVKLEFQKLQRAAAPEQVHRTQDHRTNGKAGRPREIILLLDGVHGASCAQPPPLTTSTTHASTGPPSHSPSPPPPSLPSRSHSSPSFSPCGFPSTRGPPVLLTASCR